MKNFLAFVMLASMFFLGAWCWIYRAYEVARLESERLFTAGDAAGAQRILSHYNESRAAYPFGRVSYLDRFAKRLKYHEGAAQALLGDTKKAESAFRDSAGSHEKTVASASRYNGAEYLRYRGEWDGARDAYAEALKLDPNDRQAKINLEKLLKKMKENEAEANKQKKNGKNDKKGLAPSDYWNRDNPDEEDSESGDESNRIYR